MKPEPPWWKQRLNPFTAMPLQRVPFLRTTLQRRRLMLPGLHWLIRRDAFQAALPDPALRAMERPLVWTVTIIAAQLGTIHLQAGLRYKPGVTPRYWKRYSANWASAFTALRYMCL